MPCPGYRPHPPRAWPSRRGCRGRSAWPGGRAQRPARTPAAAPRAGPGLRPDPPPAQSRWPGRRGWPGCSGARGRTPAHGPAAGRRTGPGPRLHPPPPRSRVPAGAPGRLLGRALCQGAALRYVNGSNGVKDFDVWSFYTQYDGAEGDKPQTATIPVPVQAPVMTAGTGRAGKPLAPSLGRAVISSGRRH